MIWLTSLQIPLDCTVVIWLDKDQVLPVKTPVWSNKKMEEREKKKLYLGSEFRQQKFYNCILTHFNIFTWIMISVITSNLNYASKNSGPNSNYPNYPKLDTTI